MPHFTISSPFFWLLVLTIAKPLEIFATASEWINYPPDGFATMTHYDLPLDDVAACGCTPSSTHYPTVALSQMAFGSSAAFGPGCGKCFNLTLLNTFESSPPFFPAVTKSIVVKVTDLCPLSGDGWCSGTQDKPNPAGQYLNFDLAFPSMAVPADFFPSNVSLYGYTDFGVWNISYQTVTCEPNWAGSQDPAALGSVTNLGPESVCCPANPTGSPNDTCPSYSDQNGLPPDTHTNLARELHIPISLFGTTLVIMAVFYTL